MAATIWRSSKPPTNFPRPAAFCSTSPSRTTNLDAVTESVRDAGCKITVEPQDVTIQTTNGAGPVPVRLAFFEGPNGEIWELLQNERT